MTPLRRRLVEDLQLRGFSDRSIVSYVRVVAQLARFYDTSPDRLSEEQIRHYLIHLTTVRKVARSTHTIAICALKFFYERTLGRKWTVFGLVRPKRERKLPLVLSRDEVWKLIAHVRVAGYRVCLVTLYTCGLRANEAIQLRVADVDGSRKTLHIHGKGGKDRYVPLPDGTLELLRQHWCSHRNPVWLFPSPHRSYGGRALQSETITRKTLANAFHYARAKSGIRKRVHLHTLRHCYATHLLEAGVEIRLIQEYLGHSNAHTTAIYAHLTREIRDAALDPINGLIRRI